MPNNWCFQTVVLEKTLESPLHIKEIKPGNCLFSQLLCQLFNLLLLSPILIVLFALWLWFPLLWKAFKFNWVPLAYFNFYFHYSRRWGHRGSCCDLHQRVFCLFPSKSFMVFSLTFMYLIHFEFIFLFDVRRCPNFILLHLATQFSQHHLLNRQSFLHCIFFPPLSKIRCPYICGFISGFCILFHSSIISVFVQVPYCFDDCSIVV